MRIRSRAMREEVPYETKIKTRVGKGRKVVKRKEWKRNGKCLRRQP